MQHGNVKDAARAGMPDATSGWANKEEDSQINAAPAMEKVTQTVPRSAVIAERVETAETD